MHELSAPVVSSTTSRSGTDPGFGCSKTSRSPLRRASSSRSQAERGRQDDAAAARARPRAPERGHHPRVRQASRQRRRRRPHRLPASAPPPEQGRGRQGRFPIPHLGEMRRLFEDIPLTEMNTSMTINATAPVISPGFQPPDSSTLALYLAGPVPASGVQLICGCTYS